MKKYKIIIVENDEDELLFMKEGFDNSGLFEVISDAKNGNELIEWLAMNPSTLPDLILSDLNMPGKNGYDIITEIKATSTYQHIPVIITSTSSTKSIIDKCIRMGATHYLVKPDTFIQYQPFVENLHKLLEKMSFHNDHQA